MAGIEGSTFSEEAVIVLHGHKAEYYIPHCECSVMELTLPWRGGGFGPCLATVPPHRLCRVTQGRRCVVLCCVVLCCVVLCCVVLCCVVLCCPALDSASLPVAL